MKEFTQKVIFRNLSKSPMLLTTPDWQTAVMKRVAEEYTNDAIECSEAFAEKVKKMTETTLPAYYGVQIQEILFKSPRYAYISDIKGDWGDTYTAEIDLIMHTVTFKHED